MSDYSYKYLWCKTVLNESVGKAALQQHVKSNNVFAATDKENKKDQSSVTEELIEDTSKASRNAAAPVHKKKTYGSMSLATPPSFSSKRQVQEIISQKDARRY